MRFLQESLFSIMWRVSELGNPRDFVNLLLNDDSSRPSFLPLLPTAQASTISERTTSRDLHLLWTWPHCCVNNKHHSHCQTLLSRSLLYSFIFVR